MKLAVFGLDHTLLSGDSDVLWCEFLIARGELLVLSTATNRFLVELTAPALGFEHLLATEPEEAGGLFTGRTVGVLNMRAGKVRRLRDWLAARSLPADLLREASCYSDSINDLAFLRAVAHPVAVDPDAKLLAHAQAHGWCVLRLER